MSFQPIFKKTLFNKILVIAEHFLKCLEVPLSVQYFVSLNEKSCIQI